MQKFSHFSLCLPCYIILIRHHTQSRLTFPKDLIQLLFCLKLLLDSPFHPDVLQVGQHLLNPLCLSRVIFGHHCALPLPLCLGWTKRLLMGPFGFWQLNVPFSLAGFSKRKLRTTCSGNFSLAPPGCIKGPSSRLGSSVLAHCPLS